MALLVVVLALVGGCGAASGPSQTPASTASVAPSQSTSPAATASPPPSPTAAPPTPTPSPTPAPQVGLSWRRVGDPDLVSRPRNGSMFGVIAGGPGAIAWGYVYATGPHIWTTADGLDWQRATVPPATDAEAAQQNPGEVLDVTAGGPGFVAVGVYFRAGGDGNTSMVWTSVDGSAWTRVAPDPVFERSQMHEVVAWKGELLAFGCENVSPVDCGGQRVWASADGTHWSVIKPSLPSGIDRVAQVVEASDRLWGLGSGDEQVKTRLTSTDGRAWTAADLPLGTPLHALPDGLYTLIGAGTTGGSSGQLVPGVYRSPDNATWTRVSQGLKFVGNDLLAVGGTMIMVGDSTGTCGGLSAKCLAAAWRSTDGGRTWGRVPVAGDPPSGVTRAWMTHAAALPNGMVVAVGMELAGGEPSTAAWVAPPQAGS